MKTRITALMLMLTAVITIQAQSLCDKTWGTVIGNERTAFTMEFNTDGTCAYCIASQENVEQDDFKMVITVGYIVPATYTRNGDTLHIKPDNSKAELQVDLDFPGTDEAMANLIRSMAEKQLEQQKPALIEELKKDVPEEADFDIVTLTENKLVLNNGNETLSFESLD